MLAHSMRAPSRLPANVSAAQRRALHAALARWFRAEQRDLPWRRTRDPYAIWISEAMLQQTRVETVVPYFARFLARFPDVRSLAEAGEGELLAAWSGLGYYSRARALSAAARAVIERHGGSLPRSRAEWLALPGVGPYTAGAVLSIAFGASEALVDGNVQRVFARLFALEEPLSSAALVERCWDLARALVPRVDELDPGLWNQALMELGARVCTARAPGCAACPLRVRCRAFATQRVAELPRPRARRAPLAVELELWLVRSRGRVLLAERPAGGRMAGLLELPTRERVVAGAAPRLWPAELPAALVPAPGAPLARFAHAITHHRIRAEVRAARARSLPPHMRWVDERELAGAALTGMAKKALRGLAEARA
jgi:A/G-specific adenine glycosylase